MAELLPTRVRRITMAGAAACLAPLLLQLPPSLAWPLAVLAIVAYTVNRRWPTGLKIVLALGMTGFVFAAFGFSVGRDTGMALLATLLAIKPSETRSARDARSLLGFSLFAPFAALLQDQGPVTLVVCALGIAVLLAALATLAESATSPSAGEPLRRRGRKVAGQLLLALPLALAAFWLFPRLATPLWGLPENALNAQGLGEEMTPDDWVDLFGDDSPALSVRFLDTPPARSELYWRTQVLWRFDGRTWSDSLGKLAYPTSPPRAAAREIRYEATMEPTNRRYVVLLDAPLEAPEESSLLIDGTAVANVPVSRTWRYLGRSATRVQPPANLPDGLRRLALQLPADLNPRTRALAAQWMTEAGGDPRRVVDRALDWISAEFSYSLTVPPTGRHGVDEFLFENQVGFCQHFSSSFVVLMRAAGIPSRVVIGYAGGARNPFGDFWTVRNMDAHAWTEVWLDGAGWVRVDPTAAVAPDRVLDTLQDRQRSGALGPAALRPLQDIADWVRRSWTESVLSFDAQKQSRMLQSFGVEELDPYQLGALFAAGIALIGALTLWYLMRGQPASRDPLVAAWLAFTRRLRRAGLAKKPSEPPLAFGRRLSAALPARSAELESLSRRYAAGRYARGGLPEEEVRRLIAELRAFRPGKPPRPTGESR